MQPRLNYFSESSPLSWNGRKLATYFHFSRQVFFRFSCINEWPGPHRNDTQNLRHKIHEQTFNDIFIVKPISFSKISIILQDFFTKTNLNIFVKVYSAKKKLSPKIKKWIGLYFWSLKNNKLRNKQIITKFPFFQMIFYYLVP